MTPPLVDVAQPCESFVPFEKPVPSFHAATIRLPNATSDVSHWPSPGLSPAGLFTRTFAFGGALTLAGSGVRARRAETKPSDASFSNSGFARRPFCVSVCLPLFLRARASSFTCAMRSRRSARSCIGSASMRRIWTCLIGAIVSSARTAVADSSGSATCASAIRR